VNTDNDLYGYVKCSILYQGENLGLTVCACYSWEMALIIGLENWKGIGEKEGEVKSLKACMLNHETSR
jgi:hypothetical protein